MKSVGIQDWQNDWWICRKKIEKNRTGNPLFRKTWKQKKIMRVLLWPPTKKNLEVRKSLTTFHITSVYQYIFLNLAHFCNGLPTRTSSIWAGSPYAITNMPSYTPSLPPCYRCKNGEIYVKTFRLMIETVHSLQSHLKAWLCDVATWVGCLLVHSCLLK